MKPADWQDVAAWTYILAGTCYSDLRLRAANQAFVAPSTHSGD